MTSGWYLRNDAYFVNAADSAEYPCRQGDIFSGVEVNGIEWKACQLIHPSCEIAKTAVRQLHVIRVHSLAEVADDRQKAEICTGWSERDGQIRIAFAHTFFLPPITGIAGTEPLFSNFREVFSIDKARVSEGRRVGALTHDARVSFIRRMIYFAYRLNFTFQQVQEWVAVQIATDPEFRGPKPAWVAD